MKKLFHLFSISAMLSLQGAFAIDWIGPIDVFNSQAALSPALAVDGLGNAVIFFNASDDLSTYYQEGAVLVSGNVENTHQYLASGSNSIPSDNVSAVAINAKGKAALVWVEFDTISSKYLVQATFLTNGIWGVPDPISDTVATNVSNSLPLGIFIDSQGSAIAAWNADDLGPNYLTQTSVNTGSSWSSPQTLVTSTSITSGISLKGVPLGETTLISAIGTFPDTLFSNYFDGASWTSSQTVSLNVVGDCTVSTALSTNALNDSVTLFTNDTPGGLSASFGTNGVFGSVEDIYDLDAGTAIGEFAVALADTGSAIALWTVVDAASEYHLFASRYTNGAWGDPLELDSTDAGSELLYPNIGVDLQGNAYAVWEKTDNSGDGEVYFSNYFESSNSWASSPELISTLGVSSKAPKLSMNDLGAATVVWSAGSSGDQTIQAVYVSNQNPEAPQDLKANRFKNKFMGQIDLVNKLTWTPSTSDSVVSYIIHRDGALIGSVAASKSPTFLDHNRRGGETYVYLVTAVNSDGLRSFPTTLVFP